MTRAQPLIQTLPMTLGAPMSDDPSNPTAIEIPLQIELPNGQTLFAAVALGGLPFDGQRQIAERIAAAWNAFTGVTTEEIKAPVKCLHQIAEPAAVHPDDVAVDALAALMKAKLAKQRAKGYGGWDTDCTQQRLSDLLRGHVDKGDPVDVANFCAFLLARGEGIAAAPQAVQPAVPVDAVTDLKNALADAAEIRQQLRLMEEHARGDVWRCQADAANELASMGNRMGVLILASDLRNLLAAPAHPAEGVPAQDMVSVKKEDANAFCRILTALGMEEEGDPVAEVQRLLAATQPAAQGLDAPWGDLKVAFGCDDTDVLWAALDAGSLIFPKGWKLVETDGSCARSVAIFRVDHAPVTAEGIAVKAVIDAAIAAQAKQGGAA